MFRTCTLWAITKILNKALTALTILTLASVAPASVLENPAPNGHYSGIGVISGWKCDAGELTVRFDGGNAIPLTHGSERADTLPICGVIDTGFVALFNWNLLSDGEQTAIVYDDGIEFARATFTVTRPGIDFLRGITGSGTARLGNGLEVTLAWSEAQQSFVATRFHNPIAGSGPESGGSSALPLDIVCVRMGRTRLHISFRYRMGGTLPRCWRGPECRTIWRLTPQQTGPGRSKHYSNSSPGPQALPAPCRRRRPE